MRSFFFSSRRRHTRSYGDWSSDVCSSDLGKRIELTDFTEAEADILRIGLEVGGLATRGRSEEEEIGRASCRERVEIPGGGAAGEKRKPTGSNDRGRAVEATVLSVARVAFW